MLLLLNIAVCNFYQVIYSPFLSRSVLFAITSRLEDDAYALLVDGGCGLDCSSTECRDAFFILRVVHDECDHNTLSRASEEGLHDLEVYCMNQVCNIAGTENALLECHGEQY